MWKVPILKDFIIRRKHFDSIKVSVKIDAYRIQDMFIHGKIYFIDGQAYLVSFNFTESGTTDNYETRIRVTDIEAIRKIEEEYDG